jgi:acetyl-CoA synthetase
MLMKSGSGIVRRYDLRSLRFLSSVGEPLNPEAVVWSQEAFGLPFHDNWWQTETGGIMIANFAALDIRPGSMGRPVPGIEAAIVRTEEDGSVEEILEADIQGELALRPGWPSMFRAYWNEPERYKKCFAGGYYLTGDLAKRDRDGYFWFIGRKDDVIKTSGHLIVPFEVESALMEHKAVAESGVIGKPDPVALEIVKAFVVLREGYQPSQVLHRELLAFARTRLGAAVAPKEIEFVTSLPRTRSGKIMRRLLKVGNWVCPKGTPPHWKRNKCPRRGYRNARRWTATTVYSCFAKCCEFADSKRKRPRCTACKRFADSYTCISGRRLRAWGPCRPLRQTTLLWPHTANTDTRWREACPPAL